MVCRRVDGERMNGGPNDSWDRVMDGWVDGQMDGEMDRWMGG